MSCWVSVKCVLQVLKTIPWDKVDIEVLLVELEHAGKIFPGTREEVHMANLFLRLIWH